jgi:hypothetical protein
MCQFSIDCPRKGLHTYSRHHKNLLPNGRLARAHKTTYASNGRAGLPFVRQEMSILVLFSIVVIIICSNMYFLTAGVLDKIIQA